MRLNELIANWILWLARICVDIAVVVKADSPQRGRGCGGFGFSANLKQQVALRFRCQLGETFIKMFSVPQVDNLRIGFGCLSNVSGSLATKCHSEGVAEGHRQAHTCTDMHRHALNCRRCDPGVTAR